MKRSRPTTLASLLDRAIAVPFPSWAAKRASARLRFAALATFDAARKDRLANDWSAKTQSADGAMLPEMDLISNRARTAFYNDGLGRSIVKGHRRHIIGRGITVRANARDLKTDEERSETNAWMNWWFTQWARRPAFCDIERRKTFLGFQRLLVQEWKTAGQAFVILNYVPRRDMVGLLLQACEKEQLDRTKISNPETGYEIRNGIEINEYGAPVAYWFYTKHHPYDYSYRAVSGESERIAADRVIDLMEQDRVRQTEGMTCLHATINNLWLKKMGVEYILHRWRLEACGGASLEVEKDADLDQLKGFLNAAADYTDENGNLKYELGPGMMWPMPPGVKTNFQAIQAPGGQYVPFNEQTTREAAAGADSDYATVARDFTKGSYSAQLQGLNEGYMEWEPEQILVTDLFCRPVWEAFQTLAILENRFSAPGFNNSPQERAAYLEAIFRPQPKPDINPTDTAAARKMRLDYRLSTRRDICAEDQQDEREVLRQHSDERRFAQELDPPVNLPDWDAKPAVSPDESRPGAQMDRPVNSVSKRNQNSNGEDGSDEE